MTRKRRSNVWSDLGDLLFKTMMKDGSHALEVTPDNWPWCREDPATTQHTIQKTIDAHGLVVEGKRAWECVGHTDNGSKFRRVFLLSYRDGTDIARQELAELQKSSNHQGTADEAVGRLPYSETQIVAAMLAALKELSEA